MQNQNTTEHIHWGHFGAILLCAVFLLGVTFMRNGFHFAPISFGANKTLSYEDARAQAEKANPDLVALAYGASPADSADTSDLALLDPSLKSGSVLGASTAADGLVQVDQYFTPEKLKNISVKSLGYTNNKVVQDYADRTSSIESNYDSLALLGAFSSSDPAALQKNEQVTPLIIGELTRTPVPKDLEEYHRYKIVYYTVLQNLAEMKLGKMDDSQFADLSTLLFSVVDKMSNLRDDLQNKYQISIP